MNKTIYLITAIMLLTSCKKESSTPANNTSNTTITTTSNINFSSIGTPIGKFGNGVKDIDGNSYKTVVLGTQEWMAENLKVTKYNNGTAITFIKDTNQWIYNKSGAYCNYANNDSIGAIYGKLYNWYAVDTKKLCPTGWHSPSESDWTQLSNYLGGETGLGEKLREIELKHWLAPDNYTTTATNSSLFSALPGGLRLGEMKPDNQNKINFIGLTYSGYWWSTETINYSSDKARVFIIDKNNGTYNSSNYLKSSGLSIRCLKD
jgi:uncharacterized protein (TIGR02145 family)